MNLNRMIHMHRFKTILWLANSTIFVAMLTGTASTEEYCVSPDGKDKNPGSKRAPLRTIQAAAEKAFPGNTILVG